MSDLSFSASASASANLSGASAGVELDLGGLGSVGISIDTNLKLIEMMMPLNFVSFDYNPKTFSVTQKGKQVNRAKGGAKSGGTTPSSTPQASQYNYRGSDPRIYTFTALLSDENSGIADALMDMTAIGGGIKARCDMMMNWAVGAPATFLSAIFGAPALAQGLGVQSANSPPILIMQWGDPMRGFFCFGRLTNVKCDYKRFDSIGNPTRAEVNCTFQEASADLIGMLTNPTSGGEPGRQMHTMTQGENLQNVATGRYGRPGAWREVAEANGIDDPMRVRPGQVIAMPPPKDITGR